MHLFANRLPRVFFFFVALAFVFTSASAQTNYGGIRGEVKDIQGASIPGAQVTLTNEGTKVSRTAVTNGTGIYIFGGVDPGSYTVSITLPGFKKSQTKGNVVSLGATTTVDAALEIGATTDSVEVTADSLVLNTASASGGQLFTAKQVEDLPLLGRNPFMLEAFDANVVLLGDPRYVRAEDQTGSSQVSLAGAPSNSNSYVVDGIPISTSSGGVTFIPALESVEDAKIQSNTYDAEIGRSGGGIFASSLKSGSAQYHGVLYGETRQTGWSSNLWYDTISPAHFTATPNDTTYLYEGGFGGPLFPNWLKKPHWLENTFFWVDEAGYRQGQPLAGVTTSFYVPTAAERTGDFSADATYPLYDPTQRGANGASTCRLSKLGDCGVIGGTTDPLNVIPASYINPIGLFTANAFPLPNSANLYGGTNFTNNGTSFKSRDDTYSGKLEHTFAPWYTASASYVHSAIQEPSGNALIVPYANSTKLLRYTDATAINNTITINPTTLLTVAYGFNRYYSASFQYSTGFNAATGFGGTGFSPAFAGLLQSATFPAITLSGVSSTASIGAANSGPTVYASHNVVTVISKVIGKHNLKAGYEYRGFDVYTNPTTGGEGAFTFDGQYTNATGATNANSPGAIADLLIGAPSAASLTLNSGVFINTEGYHAVFLQDDYRLNEKITFNAGLRYEYELGQSEQRNRYNVGFDPNATYSYTGGTATAPTTVNAKGGLAFAGINGYPTHCCANSHTKYSPRVGVSYAPTKDLVIHAGYGVYFAPIGIAAATSGYSQTSNYSPGSATGPVAVGKNAYLSNPFSTGVLLPTGNTLGALTGLGGSFTGSSTYAFTTGLQDFHKRNPFVEQYSVDMEQHFAYDILVKIGYYGAHARNWTNYTNINQVPDAVLATYAPGGANAGVNLSTGPGGAKPANPYYSKVNIGGLPPTGVVASANVAQGQLLLPFPQFGAVYEIESTGYSNYNSLVVKGEKRMTKGLTVLATYTWSANWDNIWSTGSQIYSTYGPQDAYNPKKEYARSLNSIPNRYTLTASYDLPFGRGQKFLGNTNKIVDEIVGGWQINDEWIIQNGVPVSVIQTDLSSGTYGTTGVGGTYQRPNVVGDIHSACVSGSPQGRLGTATSYFTEKAYINPVAFSPALPYTYGNAPRTLPCRNPGYDSSNVAIYKEFNLSHGFHFQFRAEALNAFNTPEFGTPSQTLGLTTAGTTNCAPTSSGLSTQACIAGYTDIPKAGQSAQTLGNITTTIGFARIIQLGGRLSF
jgi:hypothetical protein